MSIKKTGKQYILEFGNGDIGGHVGKLDSGEGFITFYNRKPTEIGVMPLKIGVMPLKGEVINLGGFPVYMTFSKIESIDCVISCLEHMKDAMLEGPKCI